MKHITLSFLTGSLLVSIFFLSSCGETATNDIKLPKDTSKLIRAVADNATDWTWQVGTDGILNGDNVGFTTYFMRGIPNEVKHIQYFIDTDNNANTGFSFGQDSWKISGADILVEDGDVYQSQSKTQWKWNYMGQVDNYIRSTIEGIEQINFNFNKNLLHITADTVNVTIEPFDADWNSTYSTISTQAVVLKHYDKNDRDGDGYSNREENIYGSNPDDATSYPKIKIINDNTDDVRYYKYYKNLDFKNTNGGEHHNQKKWMQGVAVLDNGFYITSLNIKEKNENNKYVEKYLLINLLDSNGKSVGNYQVPYKSHGQDLSIEKIGENQYYIYTRSSNGKGIVELNFNTDNINFNNPQYLNKQLNITINKEIMIDSTLTAITSSLNYEKNKFVSVGYTDSKTLKIVIKNKEDLKTLKSFEFSLDNLKNNGNYNQGIAMKGDRIYLTRGDYGPENYDKKLFIFDTNTGELVESYSYNMDKTSGLEKTEPEGLTIESNTLYVAYLSRDKKHNRILRLYKLLDL